ncbi:MAG: radical SAM protein [Acidobacteriia bacterium]|nr:radical SAM protein [Terriglobia bacterium]
MAVSKNDTRVTQSGVVIRNDAGLGGMLGFTQYSGLVYAIAQDDAQGVLNWLDRKQEHPSAQIYISTLGMGWSIPQLKPVYPIPQLLPDTRSWSVVPSPDKPILVNWFITGRCPLACKYCYAEDLMRKEDLEPTAAQISETAETILSLSPVVVVLTGGDPLFSPHIATAMRSLTGRVGIIVDTSGYTMRDHHMRLFAEHGVSIRISIDSQVPRINDAQRPVSSLYPKLVSRGHALDAAMEALCRCLDAGLNVTVQTVATKRTANDLVPLGDTLFRLGVHSWRIFKVAPSQASLSGYQRLVGTHTDDGRAYKGKRAKGPYEHAFAQVLLARAAQWKNQLAIQVTYNESPNSVVLVSPDGRFVTESNTGKGKVLLDNLHPKLPRLSAVRSVVDMSGHAARYLNLTTPFERANS